MYHQLVQSFPPRSKLPGSGHLPARHKVLPQGGRGDAGDASSGDAQPAPACSLSATCLQPACNLPAMCQSCQAEQGQVEVNLLAVFAAFGSPEHREFLLLHKTLQGLQLCIAPEDNTPLCETSFVPRKAYSLFLDSRLCLSSYAPGRLCHTSMFKRITGKRGYFLH